MNFGEALESFKTKDKDCEWERSGWNGKGMKLKAQFPDENSLMTHPYLYLEIPDCPEGTRRIPWQPAQVDIFAEDWTRTK